jgi:hypothetical protein
LAEIQAEKKQQRRMELKKEKSEALERKKRAEELSYDRIMTSDNMTSNADIEGTADETAAQAYEDDFF